ncbi:hypothetical protein Patl1_23312 [Pistacia atlantica]|uniref:Uncharacterized protein n=1 Tax=Pistacia atlantica TaxID=434234 RepID=A0ACC0ZUD4_9ROSI|nr:hypothetical protein Patl1_23312 [Pistacia atlantica]
MGKGDALPEEHIIEFQQVFCLLDKDRDDCISIEELAIAIRSSDKNPTEEELHNMINEVDMNGNGTIELGEFLNLMARKMKVTVMPKDIRADVKTL